MKKNKLISISVLFTSILFIIVYQSCTYKNKQDLLSASGCDTIETKYSTVVSKIMTDHCISCHNSSNQSGGVSLEGHANVSTHAESSIARMNNASNPMPPSGKLDDCTILRFSTWIKRGKQNN